MTERERERKRMTDILRMPVQRHTKRTSKGTVERKAQIYRKSATNCCARISLHMSYTSQRKGERERRERGEKGHKF